MATKERKRDRAEADAEDAAVDTAAAASSPPTMTPSKRKADVEELEVDLEAPEPPSKKAKRALKKGKSVTKKPKDRNNDDDLTKDDDDADASEAPKGKPARSEHGVWIGNIAFMIRSADLRSWLVEKSGGAITEESITRIHLPTFKEPGRDKSAPPTNKGFAYVDFSDLGAKVAAIALSETELHHRKLLIKDSTSFEGRPKKEPEPTAEGGGDASAGGSGQLQSQKQAFKDEGSRKIFVGNLSFKVTEDDVWRNFEKCGEIEFVKVAQFEDTGKCKGYGWVKFKEPEAAAWAVKGFVKIKEQVETEDDFKDDDEDDKDRQKQFKTRKWWVNRMLGRELKLELAEDDHVRYKKRYGKAAPKTDEKGRSGAGRRENGANSRGQGATGAVEPLKESTDIGVARLTGAVVKSTGTKVTFD